MVIPLLRTPFLVLTEVIQNMLPSQIACLSLCSRRAHRLVKTHRNKAIDWEFFIASEDPRTFLWFQDGLYNFNLIGAANISRAPSENFQKIKINGHEVMCAIYYDYLVTYWDDEVFGMKIVVNYCSELFDNLDVHTVLPKKSTLWMIDWVPTRQAAPIRNVQLVEEEMTGEDYEHVLRTCKPSNDLYIYAFPPENFQFTGPLPSCGTLTLHPGHWVTIDNLMTLDSVNLHIFNSTLTVNDINQFLRNWLNGGFPRLKHFNICLGDFDWDGILDDVWETFTEMEDPKTYAWTKNEYVEHNGYLMTRDDGVMATLGIGYDELYFCVWPDFNNEAY